MWKAGRRIPVPDVTVHKLVEEQVRRRPSEVALVGGAKRTTYGQLNNYANGLAATLLRRGVGQGSIVAIALPRGPHMVAAMLAVLKSGAAYVFLDPTYPQSRLKFMRENSSANVLITAEEAASRMPFAHPNTILLDLDTAPGHAPGVPDPKEEIPPGRVAYIIYTSGSTGDPKGVPITHRSLVDYLVAGADETAPHAADTVLQLVNPSFDPCQREVFGALSAGASLYLLDRLDERTPEAVARLLSSGEITVLAAMAPTMLEAMLAVAEEEDLRWRLRVIAISGEPLYMPTLRRLRARVTDGCRIFNQYGMAECTMISTRWEALRSDPLVGSQAPIGRPIPNVEIVLLDDEGRPIGQGTGEAGELVVSGVGVAGGYLGDPVLSRRKFVADPFGSGNTVYRTGDLARWLPDGNLEYTGRTDLQAKPRGTRMEMGEIDAGLLSYDKIQQAVAITAPDPHGDLRLVAYVVPAPGSGPLFVDELRAYLRTRLPSSRIPEIFVEISELPVTPHGKVDRSRLPEPARERPPLTYPLVLPSTQVEETLRSIWSDVLGMDSIGVTDDFFDLGGHPYLAARIAMSARTCLRVSITTGDVLQAPTIQHLAKLLEEQA